MGWIKSIWQVITVIGGVVAWLTWDIWRRRRYKEKVDEIEDRADAAVQEIEQNVEEGDGAALFQRGKDFIKGD